MEQQQQELEEPAQVELDEYTPASAPVLAEGQRFTRSQLEHCAEQAILLGRDREHQFDLCAYARKLEPWRYGGRGVSIMFRRQHAERIARLVAEAERTQGGADTTSGPTAAELMATERLRALGALPRAVLAARIREAGREPPPDSFAAVLLAFDLGVSHHG